MFVGFNAQVDTLSDTRFSPKSIVDFKSLMHHKIEVKNLFPMILPSYLNRIKLSMIILSVFYIKQGILIEN